MAMLKTGIDKNQAINILNKFFDLFQKCCNNNIPPNQSEFDKYLASNFQLISNEVPLAKNSKDYLNRIKDFQKKFSKMEITPFVEEPLFAENKIIVQYHIKLTPRSGQKSEVSIMAIGTFENEKISKWTQLTHEIGSNQWDKFNS